MNIKTSKTENRKLLSPLRYPGAKRWMARYIYRSIVQNNLSPDLFVEPFAGGASVSLAMLSSGLCDNIALIDKDPLVAAFWKVLFFDTDWLIDKVLKTDVTLENWEKLKRLKPGTTRQMAFKCLYLNRTSFSGILAQNAGPIGGKNRNSKYKIDCRFNKETIINRIYQAAQYRKQVAFVWNLHWKTGIGKITHMQKRAFLPGNTLFYFDPPFFNKAKSLYNFFFRLKDHIGLRDYLVRFKQPWILSYDLHPEVISIYKDRDFRACNVNLIYTASRNRTREISKELIVSNLESMVSELQLGVGKNTSEPKKFSGACFQQRLIKNELKGIC